MVSQTQKSLFHQCILAFSLLIILLPDIAEPHGKVSLEEDSCIHSVGGNLVHFNAYQPQHEPRGQYCTNIPSEGDTFLVVDLIDPSLRARPVGVYVVRELNRDGEDQPIAYWPPATHPDGVLRGEAKLVKGLYKLIIAPEGLNSSVYLLKVQQKNYLPVARQTIWPITIILLFLLINYEFSKSRPLSAGDSQTFRRNR